MSKHSRWLTPAALGCALTSSFACGGLDHGTCPDGLRCDSPGASTDASVDGRPEGLLDANANAIDAAIVYAPSDPQETGMPCPSRGVPRYDPCVISEPFGVFVAPPAHGGSDTTGDGTPSRPYESIRFALDHRGGKGRVYVCSSTYEESISFATAEDGVAIFGGLKCPARGHAAAPGNDAWTYTGELARIEPRARGLALHVDEIRQGAHFEDLALTARSADPDVRGQSSIAVLVDRSQEIAFVHTAFRAGAGAAGESAEAPKSNACLTNADGTAATNEAGGAGGGCLCRFEGASWGGHGGSTGPARGGKGRAGRDSPAVAGFVAPYDGRGGEGWRQAPDARNCEDGDPGGRGAARHAGKAGHHGVLARDGFAVAPGGQGDTGGPGQGGGGGGGNADGRGGSGGGAGGCGGSGGDGGGGGGASVAIAVVESSVSFMFATLETADAGNGGNGAPGAAGQPGGSGATGSLTCAGGNGGTGAAGSGGGGGAGGPSIGIALTRDSSLRLDGAPIDSLSKLSAASVFHGGRGGAGGKGGAGGAAPTASSEAQPGVAGNAGDDGPAGLAAAVRRL